MLTHELKRKSAHAWMAIPVLVLSMLACQVQATDATPTAGGTPSGACDNAAFVADVSVPDGTVVKAGQPFTKTWRISNTGTCTWSAGYRLAFVAGDAMGGASAQLGKSVPPAGQADISVTLTAPNSNGTYKGDWRMQNVGGTAFGSTVYVVV
ncbi:MAG TPA: NBR1-Ig-like domain-containing protein, partial [Anaerolineales bacterium]|nr:NBR1-Ig-like domain-containing protein [Anaerolineales bacterium]